MGMFDSVYLNIKCPHCNNESEIECQTKDLDCNLEVWRKGDFVGTHKYNDLDCLASCQSVECMEWERQSAGYSSGFGRMFYLRVFLNNGIVTGEYEIKKTEV